MTTPETLAERLAKCVKPLEWDDNGSADVYRVTFANGQGSKAFLLSRGSKIIGWHDDPNEAQAAAQADYTARILAALDMDAIARLVAEAVEKGQEAQHEARLEAYARRHMNAPEDPHVETLCVRYGYGAVMDAASRLWARRDSLGAFYIGGCIGLRGDAEAAAIRARADRQTEK